MDEEQQLDLIPDAAGRMTFLRSLAEETLTAFRYDGRSYLAEAAEDCTGCLSRKTQATYDSEGVLHRREHRLIADDGFLGSDSVFYFAGRPVAILEQGETLSPLTFLSTDHLGIPVLATDESGDVVWEGGFEPFGGDWNGAESAGVFLRFPGQWVDERWDSTRIAIAYNVHRWYLNQGGRYSQPDPIGLRADVNLFSYGFSNPVKHADPDGRFVVNPVLTYPFSCSYNYATEARRLGASNGWPWAHCWASCNITRYCGGERVARAMGLGKEVVDVGKCFKEIFSFAAIDSGGSCASAFQDSDFEDNEYGIKCPVQTSCDERCKRLWVEIPSQAPCTG